jgi:hypothetical protein
MPSVRLRCRQIAEALGVAWTAPERRGPVPESALHGRDLFVLVKASIDHRRLRERGRVVWDVLDTLPPADGIDAYITSTRVAARMLHPFRVPTYTVPQHHCNVEERPLEPDPVRGHLVWIGSTEWLPPDLAAQGVRIHHANDLPFDQIRARYADADVLINARRFDYATAPAYFLHTALNAGIKVINAVGYGLPSVTEWEPWIDEIGVGCTIACAAGEGPAVARRLLQDRAQYEALRARCLERASAYALSSIASRYQRVLEEIASLPRP